MTGKENGTVALLQQTHESDLEQEILTVLFFIRQGALCAKRERERERERERVYWRKY